MKFRTIIRRFFAYVGLAVASLAILSIAFALIVRSRLSVPFQWVYLAIFTGVLAFGIVKPSRKYWPRVSFWFTGAAALTAHLAVFIPLVFHFPDFKPIWYVPIVIVETGIFGMICEIMLNHSTR